MGINQAEISERFLALYYICKFVLNFLEVLMTCSTLHRECTTPKSQIEKVKIITLIMYLYK